MHKRRVTQISTNTSSSRFSWISSNIHHRPLISRYTGLVGQHNSFFLPHSRWSLRTSFAHYWTSLAKLVIRFPQSSFFLLSLLLFDSVTHDDHFELLLHHKIILLYELRIFFLAHCSFADLSHLVYFLPQGLSMLNLFYVD